MVDNGSTRARIPSQGPFITDEEVRLVTEAVRYGWYENRNMHIDQFTKEFSSYTGMKYCLPTAHCTDAIHLALLALNIGPGDEVIVPDITWVASAAPIHYVGATPVFADIDRNDWCLDPDSFERAITGKTRAVVVVDLYGTMPRMEEIRSIARRHAVPIIEDAAEAMGAEYKNQKAGTFGKISLFSFNATKLMMAGQGGMLATNNRRIYERARKLRHHGMAEYKVKTFWSEEIGFNYQWTNMQAALALAQLRRLNELVEQKRRALRWYSERLKDLDGMRLNFEARNTRSTFWVATAMISKEYGLRKEQLIRKLKEDNIDGRPFFYPVSSMPAYARYCSGRNMRKINPVSYEISPYGLCLPSAANLTESDVEYICDCLKKILLRKH
ncbi:MAG: DegT/DnrJ/EryC1/StrS family aminotransferase [Chloroflexi bacterium]|nr:DegT/DnrJ/EryC1/StrS family aminotransferase [Chloroflexota bacterium]